MIKFNPGNVQIRFLPGQTNEVDNFVSLFVSLFHQILFSSIQIRIIVFYLNLGSKKKLIHFGTDKGSISAFD